MNKIHKRQRWLCSDAAKRNIFIVEVIRAGRNGFSDLKVVQIVKGYIVNVGQILKNEIFDSKYDEYLEGQDATRD